MTAHAMKARSPISAVYDIITAGLGGLAVAFRLATPEDRYPSAPGGSALTPLAPAAGPARPPWEGPDPDYRLDTAEQRAIRYAELANCTVCGTEHDGTCPPPQPAPPLDPLPADGGIRVPPDVARPGVWEPPTAQLRADEVLAELTRPSQRARGPAATGSSDAPAAPAPPSAPVISAGPPALEPVYAQVAADLARPDPDRAALREFVGQALAADTRPDGRRFADAVLAGERPAVLACAEELLARPLPVTDFYSGPWRLDGVS